MANANAARIEGAFALSCESPVRCPNVSSSMDWPRHVSQLRKSVSTSHEEVTRLETRERVWNGEVSRRSTILQLKAQFLQLGDPWACGFAPRVLCPSECLVRHRISTAADVRQKA